MDIAEKRVIEAGAGGADAVAVAGGSEGTNGDTAIAAGSDGVARRLVTVRTEPSVYSQ